MLPDKRDATFMDAVLHRLYTGEGYIKILDMSECSLMDHQVVYCPPRFPSSPVRTGFIPSPLLTTPCSSELAWVQRRLSPKLRPADSTSPPTGAAARRRHRGLGHSPNIVCWRQQAYPSFHA